MDSTTLISAAFSAGVLMFLAPCTLSLVPAYLITIAGVSEQEIHRLGWFSATHRRVLFNALAFVVGFSLVFILLGLFSSSLGALLGTWKSVLWYAAGVLLILFGISMLGLRLPWLSSEWHMRMPAFLQLGRPQSSLLLGTVFAVGWSPCIGPVLGSILFLASTSGTVLQGAMLLAIFSIGLSIPFLLSAVFISVALQGLQKLTGIAAVLYTIGGGILIVLGILILTNKFGIVTYVLHI